MPRKARKTAGEYTREELYARAEKAGVKYRSRMNKEQLFAALGLGGSKPPAAKAARGKAAARSGAAKAPVPAAARPKARRAPAAKAQPPAVRPAAPVAAPPPKPAAAPAARTTVQPAVRPAAPAAPQPKKVSAPAPAVRPAARTATESAAVRAVPLPPGSVVPPPPPPPAVGPVYVDRGPALPAGYGEDRIVALIRDPRCIFAYWELGGGGVERARSARGGIDGGVWVLRLVKVIGDRFFDVPVDPGSGNFYLHVEPGERYQVKIGVVLPSGSFVEIAASQEVVTPAETVSDVVDEQWMLVREEFDRLVEEILGARATLGIGASETVHRLLSLPRRLELFSGLSSNPRGGR